MSTEPVIVAEGLVKRFDGVAVVDGVSFTVGAGEVVGLLGPNGAGKTTTLRLLSGLYAADAGSARVAGEPIRAGALPGASLRARVGLLTESPGFYPRLSARENLRYFAALYGADGGDLEARMERQLSRLGLAAHADKRFGALSRGMKQKLAVIRALLHRPPVVFLDEPTVGLDPESVGSLRELVTELRDEGTAVLLCSHLLDEVERLCQRAVFLARRVVGIHPVVSDDRLVRVELFERGASPAELAARLQGLEQLEGARAEGQTLHLTLREAGEIAEVVRLLVEARAAVRRVEPVRVALEGAYLGFLAAARQEGLLP
ncbi:MAG: ABC transporter ATP-binding protein [Deltaproteobacteria bacterium]|nr:ABC transporter ATP-binding protein [Deltaproteobacteria bacterium]